MEKNTGFKRIVKASFYSYKGLSFAFTQEAAFRQEAIAAMVLLPLTFFMPVTPVERVVMIGAVFIVLIVELLNTGIEAAIDRIGLERHELAGLAKDLGSAAVMVALLLFFLTWGGLLIPKYL